MINDKNTLLKILSAEMPYLRSEYGVQKLGVFGSFVTGKINAKSDVDILIEFNRPTGFRFFKLADYLEKKLERHVDILTQSGLKSIRVKSIASKIEQEIQYVAA